MQYWLIISIILILVILYLTIWQRDGYNSSRSNQVAGTTPETFRIYTRHLRNIDPPSQCPPNHVWAEQTVWDRMKNPEKCFDREHFAMGEMIVPF